MWMFESDYNEGAHENIIRRLAATNYEQTPGYGKDEYCEQAAEKILALCENCNADVHFMVGGTQANLTVIAAALRPYQGVISADTGHIEVHETGAVEALGHKILPLQAADGKITAGQVSQRCSEHFNDAACEHSSQPKMVYISNPTELGTVYTKAELEALRVVCNEFGLYLFMDGARLGYGLMAAENDLTLPDIARLCDAFTIGGTKVGALFGEAVVLCNDALKEDFRYLMKQKGGMLAKGRLLGLQFDELFTGDLYFALGTHANQLAMQLKAGILEAGFSLWVENGTNQQFAVLPNVVLEKLALKYGFTYMHPADKENSVVRFCTSWCTQPQAVEELVADLKMLAEL